MDRHSQGQLLIDGEATGNLDDSALTRLRGRRIGFVFQHHHLIAAFTALENVMMPLRVERGRPDDEMRERAATLIEQVGLSPQRKNKANQMSGGQQQRVTIARALTMHPSLVLADEPAGNLDTKSADSVFALMRKVSTCDKTTFLIVTHDARLAARCDRIIELVDGSVISDTR